ncbi:7047_t:CDS:1, partial [Gigaspora rosea]
MASKTNVVIDSDGCKYSRLPLLMGGIFDSGVNVSLLDVRKA